MPPGLGPETKKNQDLGFLVSAFNLGIKPQGLGPETKTPEPGQILRISFTFPLYCLQACGQKPRKTKILVSWFLPLTLGLRPEAYSLGCKPTPETKKNQEKPRPRNQETKKNQEPGAQKPRKPRKTKKNQDPKTKKPRKTKTPWA